MSGIVNRTLQFGLVRSRHSLAINMVLAAVATLVSALVPAVCEVSAQTAPAKVNARQVLKIEPLAADGSINFLMPTAAVQLQSGVIAVSDAREFTVSFFSPDGKRIARVGRSGDGPGEFRNNNGIGECATDTAFVFDRMQRRFAVFTSQGKLVRTGNIPVDPSTVVCSRSGFIVVPGVPNAAVSAAPVGGAEVVVHKGTYYVLNTLGEKVAERENMQMGTMQPLGKFTRTAVSGSRIAIGTGDSAYVGVWNLRGGKDTGFRAGTANRRTTKVHIDAALDALVADFRTEAQRKASRRLLEMQKPSETLPPYSAIYGADTSGFWVVTSIPGDPEIVLTRYSAAGAAELTTSLPKGLRILSTTRRNLLVAAMTPDDEEELRVYQVDR